MQKGLVMNIPRRFVTSDWGGTETVIKETSKHLQTLGYSAQIVTTKALSNTNEETIDSVPVKRFNYTYTRLGLSKTNKHLLDMRGGNMYSLSMLLYLLLTKDIKVIHLHTLGRLGNIARLVAKMKGIPYVVSIHGGLFDLPTKQLQDLVAPTKRSFNWGKLLDWLIPSKRLIQDSSAIICVGEAEQQKLAANYPDKRVEFIPNGVDLNYIRSGRSKNFFNKASESGYHWTTEHSVILCVSSFYEQKNQMTLLMAFKHASETDASLRLVLVGVIYDQDYFNQIKDFILHNNLKDKVWVRTDVKYGEKDLADCYQAAKIFALPSRYETFGIVVLEAWAAGCAVVCGKAGGLNSLVTHGHDAVVTNIDDAMTLSQDLINVHQDYKQQSTLIFNASETVERYSWSAISQRLSDLYEEIQQEHH